MRALKVEELGFVSGGETVVVPAERPRDELGLLLYEQHLIHQQQIDELIHGSDKRP